MEIEKINSVELKKLAYDLFDSVYVSECYSVGDVALCEAVLTELEKRGYEVETDNKLKIYKNAYAKWS